MVPRQEVDIGVTADVGTLQRLPKVIGNQSAVRELAYTARKFYAPEAARLGLVSSVHEGGREGVIKAAVDLASIIASKTPLAVAGTKASLLYVTVALWHAYLSWSCIPWR